jgi:hypothetical protein
MSDQPARRSTDHAQIPWVQVGVVLTVLTVLWGSLLFWTGGLRPQTQIDVQDLQRAVVELRANIKSDNNDLRADQKTNAATCASDKALLADRIDSLRNLFSTRLDAMWRPSDYVDANTHFNRLDNVYSTLRDQVNGQSYAITDLDKRVMNLSSAPVRNPSR